MKVCEQCGEEIVAQDGDNLCNRCHQKRIKRKMAAKQRQERDEVLRSLGLTKVHGTLGGTYWE
jgi:uncharacterized Zn finger protein (UPF0148 family)